MTNILIYKLKRRLYISLKNRIFVFQVSLNVNYFILRNKKFIQLYLHFFKSNVVPISISIPLNLNSGHLFIQEKKNLKRIAHFVTDFFMNRREIFNIVHFRPF